MRSMTASVRFARQKTPESLAKSLNKYFDEQFEKDSGAIQQLLTDYKTESQRLHKTSR